MIDIQEIEPGGSYACKFRVTTMLDAQGNPAQLNVGDAAEGPGEYTGLGVIRTRDLDTQLVVLVDVATERTYTVSFDSIWDIDTVEWT